MGRKNKPQANASTSKGRAITSDVRGQSAEDALAELDGDVTLVQPPASLVHPSAGPISARMQRVIMDMNTALGLSGAVASTSKPTNGTVTSTQISQQPTFPPGNVSRRLDLGKDVQLECSSQRGEPVAADWIGLRLLKARYLLHRVLL